jgi:hypothetical protein
MSFLDPLLGVVAEVTQLGAIGYGAEVRAALAQMDVVAPTWRRALFCIESLCSPVDEIQGS